MLCKVIKYIPSGQEKRGKIKTNNTCPHAENSKTLRLYHIHPSRKKSICAFTRVLILLRIDKHSLPEEPVGKAQHLLPVIRQHGMFARTDMIAYVTFVERLVDRWQRVCANAFLAIQGINILSTFSP